MTITPSSLAAGNLVSVKSEQFAVTAQVIDQKNVIIGTFDEDTYTSVDANVPVRVYSAEDVGAQFGFGFMLHRLAKKAFLAGVVETWVIPQYEGGSDPDQATGTLDFTGSSGNVAGSFAFYAANERVAVSVTASMSDADIATAVHDAITANEDMPVTSTDNGDGTLTITSKSGGTWGNYISLAFNLLDGEAFPTGIACTVTPMAGGAGLPDIQDALDALGTGDAQNEKFFTNLIHGYGADTATLNAISTYNGEGNDFVGNYKKEIARPFRSLVGDTTSGSAGLTAALAFAALRRETDRTNGKICVPGSYDHPAEIAAQMLGVMAVTNSTRAEEGYIDKPLYGVSPGASGDRWTNDYDNRDLAVKGGVGTTFVKNGLVYAQNIITFYRPASVAVSSNGYRAMRNISIIQNMLYNYRQNFERDKWKGISIVEDTASVTNSVDREKARDTDAVIDDLVALADAFYGNAWIYNSSYPKANLSVTLRSGLTGFDITFPVILSGEGGIFNSVITFDTSIAILV